MPTSADVSQTDTALGNGATDEYALSQPGARELDGLVKRASTAYDVTVEWLSGPNGNVIQTDSVGSGVAGGTVTQIDLTAKSPWCNVKIADSGGGTGEYDAAVHLR